MSHSTLERLRQDHRRIKTLLQVLERQIASIEREDRPDYALMHDVMHYLTYYPDRYHHVFEDLLFDHLAHRRHDLKSTIESLAVQHATLAQSGVRLRSIIEAVLSDLPVKRTDLVRHARRYHTTYYEHLQCEETDMFPELESSLTQADWATLLSRFEWQHDPLFADKIDRQYHSLAQTLHSLGVDYTTLDSNKNPVCPACSDQLR